MTDHEWCQSAALYAIDALPADEIRPFEAHLGTCVACRAEVAEIREVAGELAEAGLTTPPPGLRDRVLADARNIEQTAPIRPRRPDDEQPGPGRAPVSLDARRRRRRRTVAALSAAAAAALVVVGLVALPQLRQSELEQLAAAPDAVRLDLSPNGDATDDLFRAEGVVEVTWSAQRDQAAVVASGLAEPGPGQTYQLWLLVEDGVVPAGLFDPSDGAVSEVLPVDDVTSVGWGVTIEPSTGSEVPTGDILFLGLFSS